MEYIMINKTEMKIILEAEDLKEWDVSAEELDCNDPLSRQLLEELLGCAGREFGFDPLECRTLLRLFPSRDGGCEIFVTLLPRSDGDVSGEYAEERSVAYRFERLSHLLSVCRRLRREGFEGNSSVWYDLDDRWFLTLTEREHCDSNGSPISELDFLTEYGEEESARAMSLYLAEYATSVCRGNAVDLLGSL